MTRFSSDRGVLGGHSTLDVLGMWARALGLFGVLIATMVQAVTQPRVALPRLVLAGWVLFTAGSGVDAATRRERRGLRWTVFISGLIAVGFHVARWTGVDG